MLAQPMTTWMIRSSDNATGCHTMWLQRYAPLAQGKTQQEVADLAASPAAAFVTLGYETPIAISLILTY
jgi:hypothetical protein